VYRCGGVWADQELFAQADNDSFSIFDMYVFFFWRLVGYAGFIGLLYWLLGYAYSQEDKAST
jgi:hypothetical protein